MKITYTAPNRSHHYPYADAMYRAGHLHAFVSGFSRFSPRADLPSVGEKLKRHDLLQTMYLAACRVQAPFRVTSTINGLSSTRLDQASYRWAKESDVFIYYRTQGYQTTRRIHRQGIPTICVMEEVNSHVEVCDHLMFDEMKRLGLTYRRERFPDYRLRLKAYEEADFILCPSDFVKRSFVEKGFSPERLIKVNFGFPDLEPITNKPPVTANSPFRILYVGQIHYRKGLHYAIEAFRRLKHPNKELVIVGPKTTMTGLEKTLIPDGVTFTGPLKGEALKEQYRRATVFVLPSVEEGLALVQGEALAFGLPLLITSHTGGDDLIQDGVEGFIVPPSDANALSDRLQQLADDVDLQTQMSAAGLQTAMRLGNWDIAADRLIAKLTTIQTLRDQ